MTTARDLSAERGAGSGPAGGGSGARRAAARAPIDARSLVAGGILGPRARVAGHDHRAHYFSARDRSSIQA